MPAYFDKQKKTWYVQFRYKDYAGKTRSTTKRGFARKKDALQYEAGFKSMQNGSLDFPFYLLIERYLQHQKNVIRPGSYFVTAKNIRLYIMPFFSDMSVSSITVKTIIDWHDNFLFPKNLADTTLKDINGRLSAIFNYAVKYYELPFNPVLRAGSVGSHNRKHHYTIWTRAQLEQFCNAIELMSPRIRWHALVFRLLFYTGMRPAEMLALTCDDIDLNTGTISITKSYHYESLNNGGGYVTAPKNKYSIRKISVPDFLLDALRCYIDKYKKLGYTGRLFPIRHPINLSNRIRTIGQRLGLPIIRLYDLRHSHASMLIAANIDINLIAKRLGHSSPAMTLKVYSHLYDNKKNDIIDFLNADNPDLINKNE